MKYGTTLLLLIMNLHSCFSSAGEAQTMVPLARFLLVKAENDVLGLQLQDMRTKVRELQQDLREARAEIEELETINNKQEQELHIYRDIERQQREEPRADHDRADKKKRSRSAEREITTTLGADHARVKRTHATPGATPHSNPRQRTLHVVRTRHLG